MPRERTYRSLVFFILLGTLGCQTAASHPPLAELRDVLDRDSFAIISAGRNNKDPEDARLSPAAVEARRRDLYNSLLQKGFRPFSVDGRYSGQDEKSYLLRTPCIRDAKAVLLLGRTYRQEAVILTRDGQNALVYTSGQQQGQAYLGRGWAEIQESGQDHSRILSGDGYLLRFRLNFDFSQTLPYTLAIRGPETGCVVDGR